LKIAVVGLGYVGLPTALLFAKAGNKVVGIDINKEKVEKLRRGDLPLQRRRSRRTL